MMTQIAGGMEKAMTAGDEPGGRESTECILYRCGCDYVRAFDISMDGEELNRTDDVHGKYRKYNV